MIKRLSISLLTILNLISLFCGTDLFMGNISGLQDIKTYLLTILLAVLFIMSFKPLYKIDKVCYWVMVLGFIVAIIIPYSSDILFLADIHVLLAYIGFALVTSGLLVFLYRYRVIRQKVADRLIVLFMVSLFSMLAIYLYYQAVNGLIEIIYFLSLITISFILRGDNMLE